MNGEDFLHQILTELQALIDPVVAVIKGLFNIMAQVFVFLADLLKGIHS